MGGERHPGEGVAILHLSIFDGTNLRSWAYFLKGEVCP